MGNSINGGYNLYDTIRKTPHGRFISWVASADNKINNQKAQEPPKSRREIMHEKYRKDIESSARFSTLNRDLDDDFDPNYHYSTTAKRFRTGNNAPEPKKSFWQRTIQGIKDWWNNEDYQVKEPVQIFAPQERHKGL